MTAATGDFQNGGHTFPRNALHAFHVLIGPTGVICNLDRKYCFFLSKETLHPGSPSGWPTIFWQSLANSFLKVTEFGCGCGLAARTPG